MRRIIIIGASSGIGRELARQYIHEGHRVGLGARRIEELRKLQQIAPERVEVVQIDVTTGESLERLDELIDRLGGIDLYVHCSGIGWQNAELDPDRELATVAVNLEGFTRLIAHIWRYFRQVGSGHIVGISSVAGTRGIGNAPSYSASKAYQAHYMQALRQLAHSEHLAIRVTDIRPGFVDTPLLAGGSMPMMMQTDSTARAIRHAIATGQSVAVIDWRYRLLVGLWRLAPRWLWERLPLTRWH